MLGRTDKSGKAVVCKPETYGKAIEVQTRKDKEVTEKEMREVELRVNRSMKSLTRVSGMGTKHEGKEMKLAGAVTSQDTGPPTMYILWKDHKPDFLTALQTRPVCDGTSGPLARISEVLVLILGEYMRGDNRMDSSV